MLTLTELVPLDHDPENELDIPQKNFAEPVSDRLSD